MLHDEPGREIVEPGLDRSAMSTVSWSEVCQRSIARKVDVAGLQAELAAVGLGASLLLVHAVEVPVELPLDALMDEEEAAGRAGLERGRALAESFGVRAAVRLVRARDAGDAVVGEAAALAADAIVLDAPV